MTLQKIGVVGAGVMGTGIAQVAILKGMHVILRDISMEYVNRSVQNMTMGMDRAIAKGKLTEEEKDKALARIIKTENLADLADCDLIIEAVVEDLELKGKVFAELNDYCKEATIFASNTSSMSITQLAATSGRPEQFCGIHFFNPVPVMRLVEVIRGINTSDETVEAARMLATQLGKTSVLVQKDAPGFIVNRLLIPYMNEAARILSEGVATVEDIDTAVELGLNYPMGPFKMLDMGGVDLAVTSLDYFSKEFADEGYAPQLLLRQMNRAGKKGRKTGEGFYHYE